MTLPELATLLGFDEKTARRDTKSVLAKLLAGFELVDTEDPAMYALTIRVLIECPDFRKSGDIESMPRALGSRFSPDVRASVSSDGKRAGQLPRRFKP